MQNVIKGKDEIECHDCRLFTYDHINLAQILFHFIHKSEPKLEWLDVCCGPGRVLQFVGDCFEKENIPYIMYVGYDKDHFILGQCEKNGYRASFTKENFLTLTGFVNELHENVENHWKIPDRYDRVTLILSLHEIQAVHIPNLILTLFHLCKKDGTVFLFDLERPRLIKDFNERENEEGAVYFSREEFKDIIQVLEKEFPPAKLVVGKIRYPNYETEGFHFVAPKKIFKKFDRIYEDEKKRHSLELKMLVRMQRILEAIMMRSNQSSVNNEKEYDRVFRLYQFKASNRNLEMVERRIKELRRNFKTNKKRINS